MTDQPRPALVDTHCHLYWDSYREDFDAVLARARAVGVGHFIVIGVDTETSRKALALAHAQDGIRVAVGLHPNDTRDFSEAKFAELEALALDPKVVAVGETGLDYFHKDAPVDVQKQAFIRHMHLAQKLKLPLVIHCRDAYDDCHAMLLEHMRQPVRGVMHCWGGTPEQARKFADLGMHVSFAGNVTYKKAEALRESVRSVPIDRILIETDCPFLAPQSVRGKRNEPSYAVETARCVAGERAISEDDVRRITTRNASELFGLGLHVDERTVVYPIRDQLYVNLTNRCTAHCVFCPIYDAPYVQGHYLGMKEAQEPEAREVLDAIGDPTRYREIVFCGFGEPTLKWEVLKQVARGVKERGGKTRLNTNGHGNLIHKRDITPEMTGLLDAVSVSLNAPDAEQYNKIVRPQFGLPTFDAVKDFIVRAQKHVPDVVASIVGIPNLSREQCETLARDLGAAFRLREYNKLG